jgi:bifunctional DNA-binding transcriptional regulator/antitoxin component of YhaV-PrlF toxin-antitoxin module
MRALVYHKAMERQIITVNQDKQFVLPGEVQTALELEPGSQWEVSVKDRQLVLQPALPDRIAAARGMFGPGSNLEDDLKEWRASNEW